MRKFRLFLLTLLCLAIPLQGMAGVRMLSEPCPMEQSEHMAHMQMSDMDQQTVNMTEHDCCNDADTAAKTGKMCKTGDHCPFSAQYPPSVVSSFFLSVEQNTLYPSLVLTVRSFDANSVWRPPARA
jgi:hypothetical protein